MDRIGTFEQIGRIGLIRINNPPVNALNLATRASLHDGLAKFTGDDAIQAVVIYCEGKTFFAGADISELGTPIAAPSLEDIFNVIDGFAKPVIAAIHGTALGGGYELALACHYRIAVPSAKMGLPEVSLGILPGAGGTQRLPRMVGVEAALEIICKGKPVGATHALNLGMIDSLAREGQLLDDSIAFADAMAIRPGPPKRVRDREDKIAPARGKPEIYEKFLCDNAKQFRGLEAPAKIAKAIEASVELSFDEGLAKEKEIFEDLVAGDQSAALRYYFFAERQTHKIPDVSPDTPTRPLDSIGVIGAGTMGGGIAMNFLNAGIPVTLIDMSIDALDRGVALIRKNYERTARTGRITTENLEQRLALLKPSLDFDDLSDVDLVIEAAYEEMNVKKDIFRRLDSITKTGAILASNTSYLDLDEIAHATSRPGDVIGLHFFSPANVMRLLEVVRGAATSKDVIQTAMQLAKTIGKIPVVSRVCHGFIANRIMTLRMNQAFSLVLQGPTPQEIDLALYDYGFAMGPFEMLDLVGLDVIGRGEVERSLRGDLVKLGRLGQKSGGGFYDYDENRRPHPSAVAAATISDFVAFMDAAPLKSWTAEDIIAKLLFPVVNEAAKVLEENVAIRASDIDVACVLGYNWPIFTGGPMFWCDTVGPQKVIDGLLAMGIEPAKLLVEKARTGGRLTS